MLFIILVETKGKNNDSDFKYIKQVLVDICGRSNAYKPIYLGGKTNFDRQEKQIGKLKKSYICAGNDSSQIKVLLCIDIDNITSSDVSADNKSLNHRIKKYCEEKGYELIWFYENIEQVFWGFDVPDKEKTKRAEDYIRKELYKDINKKALSCDKFDETKKGTSNLIFVLLHALKQIV